MVFGVMPMNAVQTPDTREAWFPSRYGAGDQLGALNEISLEQVVRAARLVCEGRVYDLAHVLDEHVPAFPGRSFRQHLTTSAHQENARRPDHGVLGGWGENDVNWMVEITSSTSQLGTHLDGLNHLQIGQRCYNGFALPEIIEAYGTNKLGMETVPQIVTRGVLLDIAALKGISRLEPGYVITVDDAKHALERQNLELRAGDAVLFHTGWGALWMTDNDLYLSGEPGAGLALANWLVERRVALSGCDTWSYGAVPFENPNRPFEVPQTLNVKHGVFILENLKLEALARDAVSEFMFVVSHAKLRGATGAWVAPLAIR
jgi:kynurenine formamidase